MKTSTTDLDLIEACKAGDKTSFRNLVERHSAFAYNLSIKMLKDEQEAEEATQDAFMKVYRSLSKFNATSKFSTWLYTIVYRECLNRLGKKKRYTEEIDERVMEGAVTSDQESGFDILAKDDRSRLIHKALKRLPSKEAAVLTMFYLEEQSLKEIHQITELSPANVKVILYRGRKNLLQSIKEINNHASLNELI